MSNTLYIGRFAPSPSGSLHAGSLVAAMASYLDAKAHFGKWLVRIEDIDEARTVAGSSDMILYTLSAFGMQWDDEVVYQSTRQSLYENAFMRLHPHTYACACSRREIADSHTGIASDGSAIYPGTCRDGLTEGKIPRSWRLRVPDASNAKECITFSDRLLGNVTQHLATEAGDFVLKRADGFWAYQLAVVVDDADQGVTHVVRGSDLLDSTPRQIYLQELLGYATPQYLHVPVVVTLQGEKLSKQTGAQALDCTRALPSLIKAAQFLELPIHHANSIDEFWKKAIAIWAKKMV